MDKQITIRMPKELLEKWLAALRSGEYTQAIGALHRIDEHGECLGYCCLGVLQMVATGEIDEGNGSGYLPLTWSQKQAVTMLDCDGDAATRPWLPTLNTTASAANDHGTTFPELADAIEACAEGF